MVIGTQHSSTLVTGILYHRHVRGRHCVRIHHREHCCKWHVQRGSVSLCSKTCLRFLREARPATCDARKIAKTHEILLGMQGANLSGRGIMSVLTRQKTLLQVALTAGQPCRISMEQIGASTRQARPQQSAHQPKSQTAKNSPHSRISARVCFYAQMDGQLHEKQTLVKMRLGLVLQTPGV